MNKNPIVTDTIKHAVARIIQAWHCGSSHVTPPCCNVCSCWASVEPIIAAYERAKSKDTVSDNQETTDSNDI